MPLYVPYEAKRLSSTPKQVEDNIETDISFALNPCTRHLLAKKRRGDHVLYVRTWKEFRKIVKRYVVDTEQPSRS